MRRVIGQLCEELLRMRNGWIYCCMGMRFESFESLEMQACMKLLIVLRVEAFQGAVDASIKLMNEILSWMRLFRLLIVTWLKRKQTTNSVFIKIWPRFLPSRQMNEDSHQLSSQITHSTKTSNRFISNQLNLRIYFTASYNHQTNWIVFEQFSLSSCNCSPPERQFRIHPSIHPSFLSFRWDSSSFSL